MYEYGKITIKFTTPFITSLQSDTIFGHFAWGLRYLKGEDKLKEYLDDFEKTPFIVFSDGFLKGYLPKPMLLSYIPKCDDLEFAKKVKKASLIDRTFIFNNIDNLNSKKMFNHLKTQNITSTSNVSITQKNSINRFSNRVEEGLYSIKEKFSNDEYEVYFKYHNISKDDIIEVFDLISKMGYGKDKSTGKGRFEYQIEFDFAEKKYFTQKKDYYLNLSTCFNADNLEIVYAKTITKFPKASGSYCNEPFKNPAIMILPGSIFKTNSDIVGKAENLYNKNKHYQNGYSIGIYFNGEIQ